MGKNRWKIDPDIPPICRIHTRIAGHEAPTHVFPFKICLIKDNPAFYPFKRTTIYIIIYIYMIIYIYNYIYMGSQPPLRMNPIPFFILRKAHLNTLSTLCPVQNRAVTISSLRSHSTIPAVWSA